MGRLESAIKGLVRGITSWKEDHEGCDNGTRLLLGHLGFSFIFFLILLFKTDTNRSDHQRERIMGEIKNKESLVRWDIVLIIS